MIKAQLVIPKEEMEKIQVRITIDLNLSELELLQAQLDNLKGYEVGTLSDAIDEVVRNAYLKSEIVLFVSNDERTFHPASNKAGY